MTLLSYAITSSQTSIKTAAGKALGLGAGTAKSGTVAGRIMLSSSNLADVFVATPAGGSFQIGSFQISRDRIDVSALGIARTAFATKITISTDPAGCLIKAGNTSVLLLGVNRAGVTEAQFIFSTIEENRVIMQ